MTDYSSSKTISRSSMSRDQMARRMRAERSRALNGHVRSPFFVGSKGELIPNRQTTGRTPAQFRTPTTAPPVVRLNLGDLAHRGPNPYNKSAPGASHAPIKAQYRLMGETIQPLDLRGLKNWDTMRHVFRLRPLLRMHPFFRAVDLAMTLYDALDALGLRPGHVIGKMLWAPGYVPSNQAACGPGGGPINNGYLWPNCGSLIPSPRTNGTTRPNNLVVWGPFHSNYLINHPFAVYKPGHFMTRVVAAGPVPRYLPQFRTGPQFGPAILPFTARQNRTDTDTRTTSNGPPSPPQFPRPNPHRPPDRKTPEQKFRVGGALAAMLKAAHAATEGMDLVDALFSALPANIQNATPRTGVLRKGARLRQGTKYLTPLDKAQAVHANWSKMDPVKAAAAIAKNHAIDAVMGRMHAGADRRSNRNLGGARYLQM